MEPRECPAKATRATRRPGTAPSGGGLPAGPHTKKASHRSLLLASSQMGRRRAAAPDQDGDVKSAAPARGAAEAGNACAARSAVTGTLGAPGRRSCCVKGRGHRHRAAHLSSKAPRKKGRNALTAVRTARYCASKGQCAQPSSRENDGDPFARVATSRQTVRVRRGNCSQFGDGGIDRGSQVATPPKARLRPRIAEPDNGQRPQQRRKPRLATLPPGRRAISERPLNDQHVVATRARHAFRPATR